MSENTDDKASHVTRDARNGRNRGGAPVRNRNRLRHGLRASRLPRGCKYIELAVNAIRRAAEDALLSAGHNVGLTQAAYVNSMCRHERRAQLAEKWLRDNPELTLEERLAMLKTITDASDSRDKCLDRLKLDQTPSDPWARAIETQLAEPSVQSTDAGDANSEHQKDVTSSECVSVSTDVSGDGPESGREHHAT